MREDHRDLGLESEERDCSLFATLCRRIAPALALLLALSGQSVSATEPGAERPVVLRGAEQGPPVTPLVFDGDVRDLPDPLRWQPGDPIREIPVRHYWPPGGAPLLPDKLGLDPLLDIAQQETTELLLTTGTFTTPSRNFGGQGFTGVYPPDPVGDVGPDHYIQMINSSAGTAVRIWDKAEPVPNELATFTLGDLGKGSCSTGYGDPIVLYDRQAERWLLSEFAASGYHLCVYVSQTADPLSGGWYAYDFQPPVFPDYPKYAVWATDANGGAGSYVVGTNDQTEDGPGVYALDRGAMLAGDRASFQRFTIPPLPGFCVQGPAPAEPDGPEAPPAGEPAILMRHRDTEIHDGPEAPNDLLEMWLLDVDWEDADNTTLMLAPGIDVAEFDSTVCGLEYEGCFPQPDSVVALMPLREVIMNRLQYYNHGEFETLVGNFAVDVNGRDRGGIRWFELRREPGGDWAAHQEGTYSIDEDHRWMGSLAMDRTGNIALAHSIVSSSVYPGLRYTGRMVDDAPGWMTQQETALHEGSIAHTVYRWGDYQAMSLDPSDDCTFWFTGMDTTDDHMEWRTQVASFRFETCGCVDLPAAPLLEAAVNAENRIDLYWDDSDMGPVVDYLVQRSLDAGGPYELIAIVPDSSPGVAGGPDYSFEDTDVHGGVTYHYVVVARNDQGCRSRPINEVSITGTGSCTLGPLFAGLQTAVSANLETCSVDLAWDAAEALCGGPAVYNVYRSGISGFTPGPESLLAGGVTDTALRDSDLLEVGTLYDYVVRAADLTNGVEEQNLVERQATPAGPNTGVHTMFFDDFETAESFDAWTVLTGPGDHDCGEWERTDSAYYVPPYGSGSYALALNDGCDFATSTSLDIPQVDLSIQGVQSVVVEADYYYAAGDGGDSATVEAWDGSEWDVVRAFPDNGYNYGGRLVEDVTEQAAGNPAFQVRFNYQNALDDRYFSVDDVELVVDVFNECATGGACTLEPIFAGLQSAVSGLSETCAVDLAWEAAEDRCGGPIVYNVYRSSESGFAPGPENLLRGGLSETTLTDDDGLEQGLTFHYIVRAVDLANGVEEQNLVELAATVLGPGTGVQTLFFEEFEDAGSWETWTVINGPEHVCGDWKRADEATKQPTSSSGWYALTESSDCRARTFQIDTSLASPVLDLGSPDLVSATLELNVRRKSGDGDSATVEVWQAGEWHVVATLPEGDLQTNLSLDVTPYALGNAAFRVRLRQQTANKGKWWSADELKLIAEVIGACTTVP